jgi:thymidine phosphorylase
MLLAAGIASTHRQADSLAGNALSSGRAADVFGRMVSALGGPADFVEKYETYLPRASVTRPVKSDRQGFVTAIASRDIGIAVVALGGGRTKPDDMIDPAVGITALVVGTDIARGDALAIIHARNEADADQAEAAVRAAYTLGEGRPRMPRPVIRRIALSA